MVDPLNVKMKNARVARREAQLDDARKLWVEAGRLYTKVAVDEGVGECQQAIKRCT